MTRHRSLRCCVVGLAGVVAVALGSGCGDDGGGGSHATPVPTRTPPVSGSVGFSGKVYSGSPQTPVRDATITLYAAGSGGYGSGAIPLASTTTDSSGSWLIRTVVCPANDPGVLTYVTATGGDAGSGINAASGLLSLTGPCQLISTSTFVATNERTTVAAEWALAQFIAADGASISTSPTNQLGLANAFLKSHLNLVPSYMGSGGNVGNTGLPAAFLPTAAACASGAAAPPVNCDALERINTLANIIGPCIRSSGPGSTPCSTLFANAGNSTTTLQAVHAIVTHPMRNVAALFALGAAGTPTYEPRLTDVPDGWELALNIVPAGVDFDQLLAVAIDSRGYAWGSNLSGNTVSVISPIGFLVGNHNPVGAYFAPYAVAIDAADDVWVTNTTRNSMTKLDSDGHLIGDFRPSGAQLSDAKAIAISPEGDVFVASENPALRG